MWVKIQKILDSDGLANDQMTLNYGLAVSSDVGTILVGSPYDDDKGTNAGKAIVFIRSDSQWIQQAKLLAADGAAGDNFGSSVSVSADGNTALIGSPYDDFPQTDRGSAYVFTRSGTTWTQQFKVPAADGATGDLFGFSVSLSANGNTAAVGAANKSSGRGSVYIFVRSGVTWTQQAKLLAADGLANDQFGNAISLSNDGNTILIGAVLDDTVSTDRGSAYVFTRSGTTWTQQAKLLASDGLANDEFGVDVSLSGDGNTALIGAVLDDTVSIDRGSAYVFTRSGTTWTQQAKLLANDGSTNDQFGYSVSLSFNGDKAVVGSPLIDSGNFSDQGGVYVFTRAGTVWTQEQKIIASDGATGDNFGNRVVVSPDGQYVLVGSPLDDDKGLNSGSFYIFNNMPAKMYLDGYRFFASVAAISDNTSFQDEAFGTTWFKKNIMHVNTLARELPANSPASLAGSDINFPEPDTGTEVHGVLTVSSYEIAISDIPTLSDFLGDFYVLVKLQSVDSSVSLNHPGYVYGYRPSSTLTIGRGIGLTVSDGDFYQLSATQVKARIESQNTSNTFATTPTVFRTLAGPSDHFNSLSNTGDVGQILFKHNAGIFQNQDYLDTIESLTIRVTI